MKKVFSYFLNDDFNPVSWIEMSARFYLGYIMLVNAPIGITVRLEDLGLPEPAYEFIKTLWNTGYLMHLTKGIELITGICFLFNLFVPLSLILLAPVLVNIFCIGFTVLPGAWKHSLPLVLIFIFLVIQNKKSYSELFKCHRGKFDQRFSSSAI